MSSFLNWETSFQAVRKHSSSGFLDICEDKTSVRSCYNIGQKWKESVDTILVFGIGGSSLGIRLVQDLFPHSDALIIIDHLNVTLLQMQVSHLQAQNRRFGLCFISKSGETFETLTMMSDLYALFLEQKIEIKDIPKLVITEDRSNTLRNFAEAEKCDFLPLPVSVGGRYSIFSPVGMFFLFYLGETPDHVLQALRVGQSNDGLAKKLFHDFHNLIVSQPNLFFVWCYDRQLVHFGSWFQQLWCESLGKKNLKSKVPVVVSIEGPSAQHSLLQQVVEGNLHDCHWLVSFSSPPHSLSQQKLFPGRPDLDGVSACSLLNAEVRALEASLQQLGKPVLLSHLSSESEQVKRFEVYTYLNAMMLAVATLGFSLGIDPFDQPGVEENKKRISHFLKGN